MSSIGFQMFYWYRVFCHRTESDLLLFVPTLYMSSPNSKIQVSVCHTMSIARQSSPKCHPSSGVSFRISDFPSAVYGFSRKLVGMKMNTQTPYITNVVRLGQDQVTLSF